MKNNSNNKWPQTVSTLVSGDEEVQGNIPLFNKSLHSAHCMPGTVLGAGKSSVNETVKIHACRITLVEVGMVLGSGNSRHLLSANYVLGTILSDLLSDNFSLPSRDCSSLFLIYKEGN